MNGIPYNSVSAYKITQKGEAKLLSFIGKTVKELMDETADADLIFRTDRNINYQALLNKDTKLYQSEGEASAEYIFYTHHKSAKEHVLLTQEECLSFVPLEIHKTMKKFTPTYLTEKIVLGISGDGHSNTLLKSLLNIGVNRKSLFPVIMMGIPDWDKGLEHAQKICAEAGLPLCVITAEEVGTLLGCKRKNWAETFAIFYPDADLEVIEILAVCLTLSHVAKEIGTNFVITGLNLEDILSESFYAVMQGADIPSFPQRTIDNINFLYPLYRCPKRILGGFYSKFSLDNYLDRYPSDLYWRAISYYLAQSVSTILLGAEFMLVDGFQRLSMKHPEALEYHDMLGFSTKLGLSASVFKRWRSYLAGEPISEKT